ncbi:hypothetical protein GL284_08990 [Paracoccus sp. DK608]|uniref:Uncharacterized protein n=1 Tax=Paracoccus shanxieyensis TaxID=2675752 RepID=A0A6L6J160_9RHOB|nr:hypothetical protein [Paracoccus shanxieyensis]MTH87600.1 hypothetical protein [Paracoccus shanxieyensis]
MRSFFGNLTATNWSGSYGKKPSTHEKPDNPSDPFKKALTEATRAMAEDHEPTP